MSFAPQSPGLAGVLGVVTAETDRGSLPEALRGIELRADLFPAIDDAFTALDELSASRAVLFTLRLASQGGEYDGDDLARVRIFERAFEHGATLVDIEHGSAAAASLRQRGEHVLLSWHDFDGMPDDDALAALTREMTRSGARAIKVVPSAKTLDDAARMLEWVEDVSSDEPQRVGFAMGQRGLVSRVLSLARGAPWTYGSIETSTAPGQPNVAELLDLYRVESLGPRTKVFGVVGNPVAHSLSPHMHNPALAAAGIDAVYVPILLDSLAELESCWRRLRIAGLSVTIPFKEAALARADEADRRSESCGAANTLTVEDFGASATRPRVKGHNTDFDGVLVPLSRRVGGLAGLSVAVIGNGGAARGAVRALLEVGARPVIHYRNPVKGQPVAEELGVESAHLDELRRGRYRVLINATPLGLDPDDPSPVPTEVLDSETIAFDMVYEPRTRFIESARERGAEVIPGREMLVAQGRVQFRLFTGVEAEARQLETGFRAGQESRS